MSHIVTTLQKQIYHVETSEDPSQKITLDDHVHTLDWKQIAPLAMDAKGHETIGGRYSLLLAGKSYEVFARRITRPEEKNGQTYEISIDGQRFEVKAEDERARALAGLIKGIDHSGTATIYAPMPGLVVGILLETGTEVKAGQAVIILEAMKMENDLSSPIDGKIKEIHVNKGQTVDLGTALVVIAGNTSSSL